MKLDPETLHRRIADLLQQRRRFVVATIIEVKGSCPQRPGARMIIHPDKSFEFTIGGGPFEAEVIRDGLAAFGQDGPDYHEYKLTKPGLGMYCQGIARVMFEKYTPRPQLMIFGGGHIGQALSKLAGAGELLSVTVVDDRPEYSTAEKHPLADRVIHTDRHWKKNVPDSDEETYLVIVTRCHPTDRMLVERYIGRPRAYLGVIGSEGKIRQFRQELLEAGISQNALDTIHAPIGIPIGGKSPAEVAVSILAEIIQVKNEASLERPASLQLKTERL